jgi:hypothetical protein
MELVLKPLVKIPHLAGLQLRELFSQATAIPRLDADPAEESGPQLPEPLDLSILPSSVTTDLATLRSKVHSWLRSGSVPRTVKKPQRDLSTYISSIDKAICEMKLCAVDEKAIVRLAALQTKGASSWLYPGQQVVRFSASLGVPAYLPAAQFQAMCNFRFGLPIYPTGLGTCQMCNTRLPNLEDHTMKCMEGGVRVKIHNQIRDTVYTLARYAGLRVDVETMPFVGTQLRLDLVVRGQGMGPLPVATDITLVDPFHSQRGTNAVTAAAGTKKTKYAAKCRELGWDFAPGAINMYADMCGEFRSFLVSIATAMSANAVCDFRTAVTIVFGRVNSTVARAVGSLLIYNKRPF